MVRFTIKVSYCLFGKSDSWAADCKSKWFYSPSLDHILTLKRTLLENISAWSSVFLLAAGDPLRVLVVPQCWCVFQFIFERGWLRVKNTAYWPSCIWWLIKVRDLTPNLYNIGWASKSGLSWKDNFCYYAAWSLRLPLIVQLLQLCWFVLLTLLNCFRCQSDAADLLNVWLVL